MEWWNMGIKIRMRAIYIFVMASSNENEINSVYSQYSNTPELLHILSNVCRNSVLVSYKQLIG